MPVKKNTVKTENVETKTETKDNLCFCNSGCNMSDFAKKLMMTFLGILLVYVIFFVGVLIRNEIKKYDYIGLSDKTERMITISAVGESTVKPDVAKLVLGVTKEADSVEEAQIENTKIMNSLLESLKGLGIDEKDIQTANYSVNPIYDWTEEDGRILKGYEVSQQVSLKIKDTSKTSEVISLAGTLGITNISNLEWIVDDKDYYLDLARQDALEKVKDQAETLTKSLGVKFVSIISYNEYKNEVYPSYARAYETMDAYGLGAGSTPTISEGEENLTLNVNITFEIK